MEFWIGLTLVIAVMVVIVARRVNAFAIAKAKYEAALAALENDPSNVALRRAALQKGRVMTGLYRALDQSRRGNWAAAAYDETRVRNDIDAISAVSAGTPLSHADELQKLAKLHKDGVISIDELTSLKARLSSSSTNVQDVIRLLRGLKDLEKEGVLTPGEFNMKKWEILSKRLLNETPD